MLVNSTGIAEKRVKKQLHLPGINDRTTAADRKAFVQSKLVGFELRQQERARKRAERPNAAAKTVRPAAQEPLFRPHESATE